MCPAFYRTRGEGRSFYAAFGIHRFEFGYGRPVGPADLRHIKIASACSAFKVATVTRPPKKISQASFSVIKVSSVSVMSRDPSRFGSIGNQLTAVQV
jgi:hypothetical protein